MRCAFPLRAAALAALFLLASAAPAQEAIADRPNVLLILADDLGFSDLGSYGGEIPTPHLDRLAGGGARFSDFTNSARCCPSRASLLTGLHPHQTGVGAFATRRPREGWGEAYTGHLLDDCATLAELLGNAGYGTWMVGKWHLGTPGPIERGFQNYWGFADPLAYSADQWDPSEYARLPQGTAPEIDFAGSADDGGDDFYATDAFTDYALEFLRQARAEPQRPWFLYVAHSAPHFPVQAPKESIDRHVDTYRRGWDALRAERFARMQELGLVADDAELPPRSMVPVDDEDIANGYPGERNPAWDSLPEARREDLARRMATYAAMVEHVDRGVGRLLADLEEHGELDNTLILFLSDNGACYEWGPFGFDGPSRRGVTKLHEGEELERIGQPGTWHSYGSGWANLCNTPLNLYKHFCHEGGIASPLIVHWPERIAPRAAWVRDPAHLMDVVPTVLEATGVAFPEERDGHALQPLEGTSLLAAAANGEALPERALAYEHMGARGLRHGRWKITWGKRMPWEPRWALYDLATDRSEQHDLSDARPELKEALVAEWEAWARRVGAEPFQGPAGDALRTSSPWIHDRPFTVRCRFDAGDGSAHGVLLAQGGRSHGWALHLMNGRPVFDVRRGGEVTRLAADATLTGEVELVAVLDEEEMSIRRGERLLASRPSPGLMLEQPLDELAVGRDTHTAAGDYEAPNAFSGSILDAAVEPRSVAAPEEAAPAEDPAPPRTEEEKRARPNVIVILADDQGWGTTSIAYDPRVPDSRSDFFRTPALERLAARGRRFTQGYSAHPNCSPSRAALLTGRSPAALRFTDICGRQSGPYYEGNRLIPPRHVDALAHEERTIPELLNEAHPAYRAAHFGKWHLRGGGPEAHGFDGGDGETGNREGTLPSNLPDDPKQIFGITERGIAWMEAQVAAHRPFYLQLSHYATHLGYQSRPATRVRFAQAEPGARHDNVRYAAMLADLDAGVGQVLDAVDRLGIADHTYVIYTADNGTYPTDDPANVNGPIRGTKATLWEGGVRVPFLVAGPGIAPGSVSREPVIGWDLLPTVCALAGVPGDAVPDAVEGGDLSPALFGDGPVQRRRNALAFHWPHYQHQKDSVPTSTILHDGLKLHWFWEHGRVEMYDLRADLDESADLAPIRPQRAAALRERLMDWLHAVDAQRPRPNPDYDPVTDPARR